MNAATKRVEDAFRRALGLPGDQPVAGLEYRQIQEWDSVAHMHLVSELEAEFDILMETDHVLALSSFAKALEILRTYGVDA